MISGLLVRQAVDSIADLREYCLSKIAPERPKHGRAGESKEGR
jgi:hypothetical protein